MKDEGEGAGVSMESLRLVRQACGSREMAVLGLRAEKASGLRNPRPWDGMPGRTGADGETLH